MCSGRTPSCLAASARLGAPPVPWTVIIAVGGASVIPDYMVQRARRAMPHAGHTESLQVHGGGSGHRVDDAEAIIGVPRVRGAGLGASGPPQLVEQLLR